MSYVPAQNGSSAVYNDSGIEDFDPENSVAGSSTFFDGGGGLVGESAVAGAPTWVTAVPALAVIAYVGYRRFQGEGGGGTGSSSGSGSGGVLGRLRGR